MVLGSFNWGVVILDPDNNFVTSIFNNAIFYNIVYAIVFLSGLICAYLWLAYNQDLVQ